MDKGKRKQGRSVCADTDHSIHGYRGGISCKIKEKRFLCVSCGRFELVDLEGRNRGRKTEDGEELQG